LPSGLKAASTVKDRSGAATRPKDDTSGTQFALHSFTRSLEGHLPGIGDVGARSGLGENLTWAVQPSRVFCLQNGRALVFRATQTQTDAGRSSRS
jgi:hypothetical protein